MGIDYCVYRESRECSDLINYTYDPIKHRYYEDENAAISDEMRDTPGNIYTGSIQACPFSMTINRVFIETNTSLEDLKDAGLAEDTLCIDKYENIYEYAVNRPVYIQGFNLTNEKGLNRNFISHGMNRYNPDNKDCLKLFVLLFNIYLLFDTEVFAWK